MSLTIFSVALVAIATMVGATIQGATGFGMNIVTVPIVALLVPRAIPVTPIIVGVPITLAVLRHERLALDRTGAAWLIAGLLPGSLLGAWVATTVSINTLQLLAGALVLGLVLGSLVLPPLRAGGGSHLVAGVVSGVTGTAAGIGGPPIALLYQHREAATMRATLAAALLVGAVISIATLALVGDVARAPVLFGVGLAPLSVAGAIVGRRLHNWLDRGWLRPVVLGLATATAALTLANALF
jgi:hypothetical protein